MKHVYEFAGKDPGTNQGLLSQLVVPRPIAMVSTRSPEGRGNLSPFSYYLPITGEPPLVGVTFGRKEIDGRMKDSYENLMASGDFVINVCSAVFADHIESIAKEYPLGDDEAVDARLHARRLRQGVGAFGRRGARPPGVRRAPDVPARQRERVRRARDRRGRVRGRSTTRCWSRPTSTTRGSTSRRSAPIGRSGARTFIRTTPEAVYHQERHPYVPASMKALLYEQPGGPEVLRVHLGVADPEPGPRTSSSTSPRPRSTTSTSCSATAGSRCRCSRCRTSPGWTSSARWSPLGERRRRGAGRRPRGRRSVARRHAGGSQLAGHGRPLRRARRHRRHRRRRLRRAVPRAPDTHVLECPTTMSWHARRRLPDRRG